MKNRPKLKTGPDVVTTTFLVALAVVVVALPLLCGGATLESLILIGVVGGVIVTLALLARRWPVAAITIAGVLAILAILSLLGFALVFKFLY